MYFSHLVLLFVLYGSCCNSGSYFTWTEYAYEENLAASCAVTDKNGDIWLCGGKSKRTTYNSCRKISIDPNAYPSTGYISIGDRKTIQQSSYFPGYYSTSSSFFCETENIGGLSLHDPTQSCFVNLDESTNDAKCICCDLDIDTTKSNSKLKCDDLSLVDECKDIFQSCLVYDDQQIVSNTHNTLIQIGGHAYTSFYDTIDCFNIDDGTYMNDENELETVNCKFGNLQYGTKSGGCSLIDNKIIVVGGESSELGDYMDVIQICENDGNNCYESTNAILDRGIEQAKVINMDECIIAIMGGKYSLTEYVSNVTMYDACNDEIIGYDELAIPMSEFSIYIGNGFVCTIGGITNPGSLVKKMYCSPYTYTNPPIPTKSYVSFFFLFFSICSGYIFAFNNHHFVAVFCLCIFLYLFSGYKNKLCCECFRFFFPSYLCNITN